MTLAEWLSSRRPAPPPRLLDRMERAIVEAGVADSHLFHEGTRLAAVKLLRDVVAGGGKTRAAALDLLAADALITYSCEAACDDAGSISGNMQKTVAELEELIPLK